jgi:hypothetical protein
VDFDADPEESAEGGDVVVDVGVVLAAASVGLARESFR